MTTARRQNARWLVRAFMESPFYFSTPLRERLRYIRQAVAAMELG